MSRTVYVNGAFVNEHDARISIFDRSFLFADGVYEVTSVLGGKMVDNSAHLARLQRSCRKISQRDNVAFVPADWDALLAAYHQSR